MKGLILAGGSGTRIGITSVVVSKHLLPVYDRPMILYSVELLVNIGIKEIIIVTTPRDLELYVLLLEKLKYQGVAFHFVAQATPKGVVDALILTKRHIDNSSFVMVLGDNLFIGDKIIGLLQHEIVNHTGCCMFGCSTNSPNEFGMAVLDDNNNILELVEKPEREVTGLAITGLYIFDENAFNYSIHVTKSPRGELEICDLHMMYHKKKAARIVNISQMVQWFDLGNPERLLAASNYIYRNRSDQSTRNRKSLNTFTKSDARAWENKNKSDSENIVPTRAAVSPVYQDNDLKAAMARANIAAKMGLVVLPPVMDIHLNSTICNLSCDWCIGGKNKGDTWSLEDRISNRGIDVVLNNVMVRGLEKLWPIEFHIAGANSDPLLSKHIIPTIRLLRKRKRIIQVTTNGCLRMSDELIEELSNIRYLNISLDVVTEQDYWNYKHPQKAVKGRAIELVLSNIQRISSYRDTCQNNLTLATSFVATPITYEKCSWKRMFLLLEKLGVNSIRIRDDLNRTYGDTESELKNDLKFLADGLTECSITLSTSREDDAQFDICRGSRLWPTLGSDGCLYDCGHVANSKYKPFADLFEEDIYSVYSRVVSDVDTTFRNVAEIGCERKCAPLIARFNSEKGWSDVINELSKEQAL